MLIILKHLNVHIHPDVQISYYLMLHINNINCKCFRKHFFRIAKVQ